MTRGMRQACWVPALALLAGCQSSSFFQTGLDRVNEALGPLPAPVAIQDPSSNEGSSNEGSSSERVELLLATPVDQNAVVELALIHSRALQAILSQGMAEIAEAGQTGRLPNPVFSYERMRSLDEREVGRALSIGLLDLLTWPQRRETARALTEAAVIELTGAIVDEITAVRTAWVSAVAAEQRLVYARQVLQSAEASAELARRMEAAGNFNRLARSRQQLFESLARAELAAAEQSRLAQREALVRLLGLDDAEAGRLQLPTQLPSLPASPLGIESVRQRALSERLDVALAEARFQAAAKAEGLTRIISLGDLELSRSRERKQKTDGDIERVSGYELELVVPLFDAGELRRGAASQRALASVNQLDSTLRRAGSHLRESYALYRNSHEVARLYLDEVIPLRKQVSEETLLRYNAMLLGVFELLADAREQRETVMQAIRAQEDFWRAEADLQAAMLGRPMAGGALQVEGAKVAADPGH